MVRMCLFCPVFCAELALILDTPKVCPVVDSPQTTPWKLNGVDNGHAAANSVIGSGTLTDKFLVSLQTGSEDYFH